MPPVRIVTWPRGGESLMVRTLQAALGKRAPWLAGASARDDGSDPVTVPPGARLVVEHEEFPQAVAARFAGAVAGGHPDGLDAFRRFASEDFGRFLDFMEQWGDPEAPDGRLVVPRAALRADPAPWLAWASGALDPALLLEGEALAEAAAHLAGLAAEQPEPALPGFVDEALARQLGELRLRREVVSGLFEEILGRPADEKSILRHQGVASAERLKANLSASPERLLRSRRMEAGAGLEAAGDGPAPDEAAIRAGYRLLLEREPDEATVQALVDRRPSWTALRRQLLASREFARSYSRFRDREATAGGRTLVHIHVPKTAGTSLNTILGRNFPQETVLDLHAGSVALLSTMPLEERQSIRVIRGHIEHGLADDLPQTSIYLCVLREPAPRILSFFRFVKRNKAHPLHEPVRQADMNFGRFLTFSREQPSLRMELDGGQTRRLAGCLTRGQNLDQLAMFQLALRNLTAPDMRFGLTREFAAFVGRLAAEGLIHNADLVEQNVSPSDLTLEEEIDRLSATERDILADYCRWDAELYAIAEAFLLGPPAMQGA